MDTRFDSPAIVKAGTSPPRRLRSMTHAETYLAQTCEISRLVDAHAIEQIAKGLAALRARGGRLFLLGVGGSAANCGHAVNDFRKLCGIEAYAPTDNVSELTARTNDEGWETVFVEWLRTNRAASDLSVGFVMAFIFLIIAFRPLRTGRGKPPAGWALGVALLFAGCAVARPRVLGPLNRLWTGLALVLSRVTNPVATGLLFFV